VARDRLFLKYLEVATK